VRRAEFEEAQAKVLSQAQERAEKLDGLTVQITQKAGVDGRLFGSVTNFDIVEALKAQGFDIERSRVRMPAGPLKQVGDPRSRLRCTRMSLSILPCRCSARFDISVDSEPIREFAT